MSTALLDKSESNINADVRMSVSEPLSVNEAGTNIEQELQQENDTSKCCRCCHAMYNSKACGCLIKVASGMSFIFGILWSFASLAATIYYLYLHGVQMHLICTHKYLTATGYEQIIFTSSHNISADNTFNVSGDGVDVWVDLDKSHFSQTQQTALHNGSIILINLNDSNKIVRGINGEDIRALELNTFSVYSMAALEQKGRAMISYSEPKVFMGMGYTLEIIFMLGVWMGGVALKYMNSDHVNEDMSMAKKICFYVGKTGCIAFVSLIVPLMITCWIFPLGAFVFDNYVMMLPGFVFHYEFVMKIFYWSIILTILAIICIFYDAGFSRPINDNEELTGFSGLAVCCLCPILFGGMVFGVVVKIYSEYQSLLAYGLLAVSFFGDLLTCSHLGKF